MARSKKFVVKLLLYHESYNGYDLCDGWETYEVKAINSASAVKKANKLKPKHCWSRNTTVAETK